MFRVQVRQQTTGKKLYYGKPFAKLEEAHEVLDNLDEAHADWCDAGCPGVSAFNPVHFLEDSEIYIEGDGITYWIDEVGKLHIMH